MENILTGDELEAILGANVKALRLQKNIDRETLAARAGISLSALKNLESGNGSTTRTLMRVLRSLGKEGWVQTLAPVVSINPLHMVKSKPVRQRASGRKNASSKTANGNEN